MPHITYIGRRENPCCLSIITDAYSKKIMGHYVANNMDTESIALALRMAIKQRKSKQVQLIHHSDRGLQYHSKDYQKIFSKNRILASITQNSNPYENEATERINDILKQEFMIDKYDLKLNIMKSLVNQEVH